jgi:hypothetical protein
MDREFVNRTGKNEICIPWKCLFYSAVTEAVEPVYRRPRKSLGNSKAEKEGLEEWKGGRWGRGWRALSNPKRWNKTASA